MTSTASSTTTGPANPDLASRRRLLDGLALREQHLTLAGIDTAVLTGGEGPPVVLLHGPGESGAKWLRIVDDLASTNRIVAPDLPGHGSSAVPAASISMTTMVDWLDDLLRATCEESATVVGHVLGGAVAARHAARHPERLRHLVLVDSLGLARFRPSPRFALSMLAFLARPSGDRYDRFMGQCSHDLDDLRDGLGDRWAPFRAYNVSSASGPGARVIRPMLRRLGAPIPRETLAGITVPTTLVWGRHDRANRLRIAERAAAELGWPLHVIDDCADDPARDRPEAFLAVLRAVLADDGPRPPLDPEEMP